MTEKSPKNTSFYEQLQAVDIITPVLNLFEKGGFKADLKTKKFILDNEIALGRMWTLAKLCPDRKCRKWLSIYHKYYGILPPPCKLCWKVVYIPISVVELIEFRNIQAKLKLPGKCGVENRDYTSGIGEYRVFWYCPYGKGLDAARAHYKRIRNALIKHFNEKYINLAEAADRFYLKRGCTELERDFGPSDQWDKIDYSSLFRLLETVWEDPDEGEEEFGPLVYTNFRRWIEYAVAYGDKSALKYLPGGAKLGVQSVKYQHSTHKASSFSLNKNVQKEKDNADRKGIEEGTSKEEDLLEFEFGGSQED